MKVKLFVLKTVWKSEETHGSRWKAYVGQNRLFLNFEKLQTPSASPVGDCKNPDQNNAKGTGSASVFGFLTEAFFLCLRNAAEKNSFEDHVLQAAHGHWEIHNIFTVILKRNFDSFVWVPVWGLFASLTQKLLNFTSLQTKKKKKKKKKRCED